MVGYTFLMFKLTGFIERRCSDVDSVSWISSDHLRLNIAISRVQFAL